MSLTKTEKPEDKREKQKLLREFHVSTFEALSIPEALFIPKLAYTPAGKTDRVVAFFASEIAKGQDIYTEFADSEYEPQDPERRLYKWRFNPNYKEEYEVVEKNNSFRYLIPTAELILVKTNSPDVLVEEHANQGTQLKLKISPVNMEDISLEDASIRDLAAVLWRKPVSTKSWLNQLITDNQ